eukprot:10638440-Alexandrium_andersonii.AAC.1
MDSRHLQQFMRFVAYGARSSGIHKLRFIRRPFPQERFPDVQGSLRLEACERAYLKLSLIHISEPTRLALI